MVAREVDPALAFALRAIAEGAHLVEVRPSGFVLLQHRYAGEGDARRYIGSARADIPRALLDASDPEALATHAVKKLSEVE